MKVLLAIPDGTVKRIFIPGKVLKKLATLTDLYYNDLDRQFTAEELKKRLQGMEAVITGWGNPMLDEFVLDGNKSLKIIVHTGGSVGNLVNEYAYINGIKIISGNLLYAESVAEGVLAYILMALRRIPTYTDRMKNGLWKTENDIWEGLFDQTVGIVGFGTISKLLIEMLQIFRVNIKIYSGYKINEEYLKTHNAVQTTLDDVFSSCKIVSIHSALNDRNKNLITKEHFRLLQDGSLFINTSRGLVINESDLIDELKINRFNAVLDVFETEPPTAGNPLRLMENVYLLPHMAGPTSDKRPLITNALIDEMLRFFDNNETELRYAITFEAAKRMTKQ